MSELIYRRQILSMDTRMGRHVYHDPRSRGFAVASRAPISSVFHAPNVSDALDQGSLGSCTGNALARCLSTAPFAHRYSESDAVDFYSAATRVDEFSGVYPPTDTGSSGLAVLKVAAARGLIAHYRWAFGIDQVLVGLMSGPGICGTEWRQGMMSTDTCGRVRVSGNVVGGHEYCLIGYDADRKEVIAANSWGNTWGVAERGFPGAFRLRVTDLAALLATGGDCAFPEVP
jgi:hypothetical protein